MAAVTTVRPRPRPVTSSLRTLGTAALGIAGAIALAVLVRAQVAGAADARSPDPPVRAVAATVAARYLELAAPLNARLRAAGAALDGSPTASQLHDVDLEYAAIEEDFATGLRAVWVPADLRSSVDALASAAEAVAAANRSLATATGSGLDQVGGDLSAALDRQRAEVDGLRAALGIGPLEDGG